MSSQGTPDKKLSWNRAWPWIVAGFIILALGLVRLGGNALAIGGVVIAIALIVVACAVFVMVDKVQAFGYGLAAIVLLPISMSLYHGHTVTATQSSNYGSRPAAPSRPPALEAAPEPSASESPPEPSAAPSPGVQTGAKLPRNPADNGTVDMPAPTKLTAPYEEIIPEVETYRGRFYGSGDVGPLNEYYARACPAYYRDLATPHVRAIRPEFVNPTDHNTALGDQYTIVGIESIDKYHFNATLAVPGNGKGSSVHTYEYLDGRWRVTGIYGGT